MKTTRQQTARHLQKADRAMKRISHFISGGRLKTRKLKKWCRVYNGQVARAMGRRNFLP